MKDSSLAARPLIAPVPCILILITPGLFGVFGTGLGKVRPETWTGGIWI
jgi:hypothetical protein